ncbi:hypothetical protein EMIT0P74_70198 [Pseudomonas sp. IT-P74]
MPLIKGQPAFDRLSPVPAVTLPSIAAQRRSHKCYRIAHSLWGGALASPDGHLNPPALQDICRHIPTSFLGVIERAFKFRHGNCSVITKPVSHARTMAIKRASA